MHCLKSLGKIMNSMKRKVLVAGATGQQGGSVVEALLQDGHTVIGIIRNQNSEKAIEAATILSEVVILQI